jgi:nuclease-like protein
MRQHPDPDDYRDDQVLDEELGTPVYQGTGLSVRALTAEELDRFLAAHTDQPGRPVGSGWTALDPAPALGAPSVPPPAGDPAGRSGVPATPPAASLGAPGRSALAAYRRRRGLELATWTHTLAWRAPLVAAAGLVSQVLAGQADLPRAGLAGLAAAALVGWQLRFRPSEQARAWQRGAQGERRTARLLRRLARHGYVVFHDLAVPGSAANVDHLVIGRSGVFVVDSKQWTG